MSVSHPFIHPSTHSSRYLTLSNERLKSSLSDAVTRSGEEQGIRWANLLIMSVLFNASLFCEGVLKERGGECELASQSVCM